jgi:hypothetical protein
MIAWNKVDVFLRGFMFKCITAITSDSIIYKINNISRRYRVCLATYCFVD